MHCYPCREDINIFLKKSLPAEIRISLTIQPSCLNLIARDPKLPLDIYLLLN